MEKYPRTLCSWLKTDEKILLKAITSDQSVLEVAEDLQREHVSILNHLCDMGLASFAPHSEEWVKVMGIALSGVPLKVTLDWCNDSPDQLGLDEIDALSMGGHLLNEFDLARRLRIFVAHSSAVDDLSWLATQPPSVQARYPQACAELTAAFEIITPSTLKNQILGIKAPALVRQWSGAGVSSWAPATPAPKRTKHYRRKSSRSSGKSFSGTRRKSYGRKKSRFA